MGIEIERKYLINIEEWKLFNKPDPHYTVQAYLSEKENAVVRVRVKNNEGFLTIKGKNDGIVRKEFEYKIPIEEALEMIKMNNGPSIEKNRFEVVYEGFVWEVDEFLGENAGLIIAEIELKEPDEQVKLPKWVGEEVSNEDQYYNVNLLKRPFSKW